MKFSFSNFVRDTARTSFLEEQFYNHALSRALSEAEWEFPNQILDEHKIFSIVPKGEMAPKGEPTPSSSNHPEYDKKTAYRMYGSPSLNVKATAEAIEEYKKKHNGKHPSKRPENFLKVFQHDTNPKTAGGVTGIFRNYGNADKEPISDEERKKEVEKNFDKFSALRKSNPTAYRKEVTDANKRLQNAKASKPLLVTTKGDTVTNLKGNDESEKAGHVSLGFSGTPDTRKHTINPEGDYISVNACHGKGNCVHDCLAKNGCGGFDSVKGNREISDQLDSHNEKSRYDHDLTLHNMLMTVSKAAKKENKGAIVRPDTTTGHQAYTHAEAIAKHFGSESENYKSGNGQKIKVNTYGKAYGTDKDPHNMVGNTTNIALSDQGIPTNKKAIQSHIALTKIIRQRGVPSASNQGSRIAFTVLQTKHPRTPAGMSDEDYVKYAKHKNPEEQADYEKAKSVKTIRRYDITPSTPKQGEKKEYYDEKTKMGRILHNGESYVYSDHDVPRPMETTDNKTSPTYMHDDRIGELIRHHKEHPEDMGINAIAMATSTTKIGKTKIGNSIFHPLRNVDNHETLHVMHPASSEAEHARNILKEDSSYNT